MILARQDEPYDGHELRREGLDEQDTSHNVVSATHHVVDLLSVENHEDGLFEGGRLRADVAVLEVGLELLLRGHLRVGGHVDQRVGRQLRQRRHLGDGGDRRGGRRGPSSRCGRSATAPRPRQ